MRASSLDSSSCVCRDDESKEVACGGEKDEARAGSDEGGAEEDGRRS